MRLEQEMSLLLTSNINPLNTKDIAIPNSIYRENQ